MTHSTSISISGGIDAAPRCHTRRGALRFTGSGRNRMEAPRRFYSHCRTATSDDIYSDFFGPALDPSITETDALRSLAESLEQVELKSESGTDFTQFKALLQEEKFEEADTEGRRLLLQLAGADAQARGWIYFTEVATIPEQDMSTIDALWRASSNDKFGYSVQKRIYRQMSNRWSKFFKAIEWTVGENNKYRKWPMEFVYSAIDAKPGHLPVTNCLRGTQLFEALMNHKAFESIKEDTFDTSGPLLL